MSSVSSQKRCDLWIFVDLQNMKFTFLELCTNLPPDEIIYILFFCKFKKRGCFLHEYLL